MERKVSKLGVGLALIAVLLLVALVPIPTCAAVVWSDNFDDGNFDGWTTGRPDDLTCSNGFLECTYNSTSIYDRVPIHMESNVSLGTWSFDYLLTYSESHILVAFNHGPDWYCIWVYSSSVLLSRGLSNVAGWNRGAQLLGVWFHIDVTMRDPHVIDVFVDGTHRIHYEDNYPPSYPAEAFQIWFTRIGDGIDNVVASDSIDVECTNGTCELDHYTPPTTTTTTEETTTTTTSDTTPTDVAALPLEWIAIGGGGIAVVVIVLVIFLKRK